MSLCQLGDERGRTVLYLSIQIEIQSLDRGMQLASLSSLGA